MAVSSKLKILLIDDLQEMREMLRETLRKTGFKKVSTAASSKAAFEKLTEANKLGEPFELILCDYDLPDMNGINFHTELEKMGLLKKTPYILMSGDDDANLVKTAIGQGLKHVILKPFSKESLIDKLVQIYGE